MSDDGSQRESPTRGDESELLDDPPEPGLGGSLEGYRAGRRLRWTLFGVIGCVTIAAVGFVVAIRMSHRNVRPHYDIADENGDARDRQLYWETEGTARLGLMREPPGIRAIVLPDQIVELADGYDQAQVKVVIRDGKTVAVQTMSGRVTLKERAQGSSKE